MFNDLPDFFTVDVNQDDIYKGIKAEAACCPIALAIKRTLNCDNVYVLDSFCINIQGKNYFQIMSDTNKVTDFVTQFDCGAKPEPQSFHLMSEEDDYE